MPIAKSKSKSLTLHRDTLRRLSPVELGSVHGGDTGGGPVGNDVSLGILETCGQECHPVPDGGIFQPDPDGGPILIGNGTPVG
jgi:hypothetical protein